MFQRNAKALTQFQSHYNYLAQWHTEHIHLFRIVECIVFKRPSVVDELEASVELHCLGDEKDLKGVIQTLGKSLLVDVVARLNPRQVVILFSLDVVKLFYIGFEYATALVHFFFPFDRELLSHNPEVVLHVGQFDLFVLQLVSFVSSFLA